MVSVWMGPFIEYSWHKRLSNTYCLLQARSSSAVQVPPRPYGRVTLWTQYPLHCPNNPVAGGVCSRGLHGALAKVWGLLFPLLQYCQVQAPELGLPERPALLIAPLLPQVNQQLLSIPLKKPEGESQIREGRPRGVPRPDPCPCRVMPISGPLLPQQASGQVRTRLTAEGALEALCSSPATAHSALLGAQGSLHPTCWDHLQGPFQRWEAEALARTTGHCSP